ncbi:MAG: hypothetical protein L6R39_004761, partial [Caloplaca ligustica]
MNQHITLTPPFKPPFHIITLHKKRSANPPSPPKAINLDASDPDYARSLRSIGPVQPSTLLSNSSTFSPSSSPFSPLSHRDQPQQTPTPRNTPHHDEKTHQQNIFPDPSMNPALTLLARRSQLAREAEAEFARVR